MLAETYVVTPRERKYLLAGVRLLQYLSETAPESLPFWVHEIAGEDGEILGGEDVDLLADRLLDIDC